MPITRRFQTKNGLDNNNNTIVNVTDPVNAQDAATKNFSSNASNLTTGTVSVGLLPAITYTSITGKPTTLSGYGITDAVLSSSVSTLAVSFASITGKPTTLSGYGITDASTAANTNLTGTPVAPTAATGTSTTQVATTAFVTNTINNSVSSTTASITKTFIYG